MPYKHEIFFNENLGWHCAAAADIYKFLNDEEVIE